MTPYELAVAHDYARLHYQIKRQLALDELAIFLSWSGTLPTRHRNVARRAARKAIAALRHPPYSVDLTHGEYVDIRRPMRSFRTRYERSNP